MQDVDSVDPGVGEFFTPESIVRLIVEVIEPFQGRIFDPACGSGGMFVHSAHFVERHRFLLGMSSQIYGHEKTGEAVRLAKMNLATPGLSGVCETPIVSSRAVETALGVTRPTALKLLRQLEGVGVLEEGRAGRADSAGILRELMAAVADERVQG